MLRRGAADYGGDIVTPAAPGVVPALDIVCPDAQVEIRVLDGKRTAADIAWGKNSMVVGVVEEADERAYRELAHEAVHALAAVTTKLERANAVIRTLHAELRARRAA